MSGAAEIIMAGAIGGAAAAAVAESMEDRMTTQKPADDKAHTQPLLQMTVAQYEEQRLTIEALVKALKRAIETLKRVERKSSYSFDDEVIPSLCAALSLARDGQQDAGVTVSGAASKEG